ncbi:restriction endonuclease [Mesorhizobium sp.]|uniref:restriction endonuclease n=1 Tax=Mesorhizobium sp. TaxID=1871066 RepID=UPI000FE8899E|nr:restriction endonuclease [Mesorhizobium sp.]RWM39934.1 MAG: hypothetical protein EOR75_12200 [Mesorhizobium sp.]
MTGLRPLQLAPFQENFLQSFLTRSDPRTLLVAAPGMGKTMTSHVAATRMIASGLVDKVMLISAHRVLGEQWQHVGQSTDPWPIGTADDVSVTTTYAAHARAPDRMWRQVAADTRWLFVFDEVDWAGDQVETVATDAIARFPGSRALFVSTEVPPITVDRQFTFEFFGSDALARPDTQTSLQRVAPSLGLLQKVQRKLIQLDDLSWREFEDLIAKMLEADGYSVDLMQGTKDGGVDVVAIRDFGTAGLMKSIWQAKKNHVDRKVGLSIVRELADTRLEYKASKAFIVTTSFLTSGALQRVERDKFLLGKVDRNDLDQWIDRTLRGES